MYCRGRRIRFLSHPETSWKYWYLEQNACLQRYLYHIDAVVFPADALEVMFPMKRLHRLSFRLRPVGDDALKTLIHIVRHRDFPRPAEDFRVLDDVRHVPLRWSWRLMRIFTRFWTTKPASKLSCTNFHSFFSPMTRGQKKQGKLWSVIPFPQLFKAEILQLPAEPATAGYLDTKSTVLNLSRKSGWVRSNISPVWLVKIWGLKSPESHWCRRRSAYGI